MNCPSLKNGLSALLTLSLLFSLTSPLALASGEAGDDTETDKKEDVTSVYFTSPTGPLTIDPNTTRVVSVAILPENAVDLDVTWSSDNEELLTIEAQENEGGQANVKSAVIKSKHKPGVVNITAESNSNPNIHASVQVTVSGIQLTAPNRNLIPGSSATIATLKMGSASSLSESQWHWNSDNAAVARVLNGQVTAIGEGEATITCASADGKYSDSCKITVKRNEAASVRATLSGGVLHLSSIRSQMESNCKLMVEDSLNYITNVSVPTNQGTLYYGYSSSSDKGAGVASSQKYYASAGTGTYAIDQITFVPKSGFVGQSTISYKGVAENGMSYSGEILVKVEQVRTIRYSSKNSAPVYFQADDFSAYSQALNGRDIQYVIFSAPAKKYGFLYYNYTGHNVTETNVAADKKFYRTGTPSLDNLAFVPDKDYDGSFSLSYTGCDTAGNSFRGTIQISVSKAEVSGLVKLSYSCRPGERLYFSVSDFTDASYDETNRQLDFVRFSLPSISQGELFYNTNTSVSSTTSYYRTGSGRRLEDISFVANTGFTGTVSIHFTGTNTSDETFDGIIEIEVSTSASSGSLTYAAQSGHRLYFSVSDFSEACYDETGSQLDYVRFTLPSASRGILYHNGSTKVRAGNSYYRTGSGDRLDDVSFIPDDDFTGTVSITFKGYSVNNESFTGSIRVNVSDSGSSSSDATISYTCRPGERLRFNDSEFSDASYDKTGYQLDYVRFSIPSSSSGILYYDDDIRVTSGVSYYRNGTGRQIDDISFVAPSGYTGMVSINYTGYNTRGDSFNGVIKIDISRSTSNKTAKDITYNCAPGQRVRFQTSDFSNVCYDMTDYALQYIRFTVLPTSYGTLYDDGSPVALNTSYYRSGTSSTRLIENVSFEAASSFSGSVTISYTGFSNQGNSYSGKIVIKATASTQPGVTPSGSGSGTASAVVKYSSSGQAVTFQPVDFAGVCNSALNSSLNSVQLAQPDAAAGKLYVNYTSPIQHENFDASRSYPVSGTAPLLSQVSFVPKADYQGTVSFAFTATGLGGGTCSGTIQIQVTPANMSSSFTDMANASWAVPSVDFLHRYQIVEGTSLNVYQPSSPMRRGDYILMLDRIYQFPDGTPSFSDVPADSYYASAIAGAALQGIVASGTRFYPASAVSRQDAALYLYRCLQKQNSSAVTTGTYEDLASFPDRDQVASSAVEAMAALTKCRVFIGDTNGRLNPTKTLTRAELAVILHRALTL